MISTACALEGQMCKCIFLLQFIHTKHKINTLSAKSPKQKHNIFTNFIIPYAVKAQTSLAPLSRFRGSRVTTAHAHQCCIFQSYAKTVPSRIKLTMKLTMREPTFMGSMTSDTWSRRVTSDFNSVLQKKKSNDFFFFFFFQHLQCHERKIGKCAVNFFFFLHRSLR